MKLHVLDLKSGATELNDVDDTETIGALKQKLFEASLIDVEPSKQRLIHAGRELSSENRHLREMGVGDGDVVAVMKSRATKSGNSRGRARQAISEPAPNLHLINKLMARAGSVVAQQTSNGDPLDLQGLKLSDGAESTQVGGVQQSVTQATGRGLGITLPEPDARAV